MKNILKVMFLVAAVQFSCGVFAQKVEETIVTGKQQFDDIQLVAVYPNPARERLLIEFTADEWGEDLMLRIKNSDGKTIIKRNLITALGGNMVILRVDQLPLGEYVVQLDEGRKARSVRWQKM
ncbi:MAG: hypothetical protein H6574_16585 [Lewinellaceae bacterium]|nr:hypothetical protein [Saprospiraceae bacterium]MCB9316699.1 hypothetical protein [Lewinellaceae bacterium]MCB9332690.1 hypothetical protein [Lewinellaceae bacterium]